MAVIPLSALSLAALVLLTSCENPILGYLHRNLRGEARDDARLERRRREIEELAEDTGAGTAAECGYVGLGSKPCGGPWDYLVFSRIGVDEEELLAKVEKHNDLERRMNRRYGRMSDCSMPPEPVVGVVDGRCADMRGDGSAAILLGQVGHGVGHLRFVDELGQVPEGDPYGMGQARVEGSLLVVSVSFSGGCAPHAFSLLALRAYEKSLPPRHHLYLRHADGGDACDGVVTGEVRFDLNPLRRVHPDQHEVALVLEGMDEALTYRF